MNEEWLNTSKVDSKKFICGYCGNSISSNIGYYMSNSCHNYSTPSGAGYIYICHHCNKPTYFDFHSQTPSPIYGKNFNEKIFDDQKTWLLYQEIRKCIEASAYTSAIMASRKLLMHIAVDCGAEKNKSFQFYVDFLNNQNYIPKNSKEWVDIIRTKGNDANHDIIIYEETDAKQMLQFVEMIITIIYEMKYKLETYMHS